MTRRASKAFPVNAPDAMKLFDYTAAAEIFTTRGRTARWTPVNYRRFATAAEAIRYAVEELPAQLLTGSVLEVSEDRFDHMAIRALYEGPSYPLVRR